MGKTAMNRFLEFLKRVVSTVSGWLRLNGNQKVSASPSAGQSPGEQHQAPPVARDAAKPAELGIASQDGPRYQKNRSLLTRAEHSLHQALLRANDNEYLIYPKVRMGDFVYLANEPEDRKFHVNQVLCKHVDFLFCDPRTLEPLLVIELDDRSHRQYVQIERDEFKDKTFAAIGLPWLRIVAQSEYDSATLRSQIREKLERR
jgi:hypothetical protein